MSLALVCLTLTLATKPAAYPRAELIIEPAVLAQKEVAEKAIILDVRGEKSYAAGHIPGAIRVEASDLSKAFVAETDPDKWARRLGDLGIDVDSHVVIYGDDWREAARAWWIVRYWGVADVRLLNGGWTAWKASGEAVSTEVAKPKPVKGKVRRTADRLATKEDVLALLKEKSPQIIDARTTGEYCGTTGTAKKKGAIPGAVHLEWNAFIDADTQRLKPGGEIAETLRKAGIDPSKPAVTYCQSGGRAAVSAFVLELMGGKEVRNYYRSWAEWGNADDTPVVKPEK